MYWLTKNNVPGVVNTPFQLKMKQIVNQLMTSELEIAYWHALNIARPEIWVLSPSKVIEQLLKNALFVKLQCNNKDEADVFRTFIEHNYKNSSFSILDENQCSGLSDNQIWLDKLNVID